MTTNSAFILGWYEGAMGHGCHTPREALEKHPDHTGEITAHLNGVEDGEQGDTFRRDCLYAEARAIAHEYNLIAEALKTALRQAEYPEEERGTHRATLRIAERLKLDNPRFDRGRFLRAAGREEYL